MSPLTPLPWAGTTPIHSPPQPRQSTTGRHGPGERVGEQSQLVEAQRRQFAEAHTYELGSETRQRATAATSCDNGQNSLSAHHQGTGTSFPPSPVPVPLRSVWDVACCKIHVTKSAVSQQLQPIEPEEHERSTGNVTRFMVLNRSPVSGKCCVPSVGLYEGPVRAS